MPAKPKPTKQDRPKKAGRHKQGICPQCGYIWQTTPAHFEHCAKELDNIVFIGKKTKTQMYKAACERLCQLITTWRDGVKCVLQDKDGGACGNVSQWGHVIPRGGSKFLYYSLSNSFRQCDKHNLIHDRINPDLYLTWYEEKWGRTAKKMLNEAWQANRQGVDWNEQDYWNMLINLSDIYDLRFGFGSATIEEKVEAGFYGSVIKEAWIKDGRI